MKTKLQKSVEKGNGKSFKWGAILPLVWVLISTVLHAQTYSPRNYWTFNQSSTKDSMNRNNLDFTSYACNYAVNSGLVGKCLTLDVNPNLIMAGIIDMDSAFTIEFLIKPGYKFNNSKLFSRMDDAVGGAMGPDYISFYTNTKTISGSVVADELKVNFDGIGRKSLSYYVDGNWHHVVMKYNAITGVKEIWVDAQKPTGFSKTIAPGLIYTAAGANRTFYMEHSIYYVQYFGDLDEIAIYTSDIPSTLIYKHYLEATAGNPYSFNNVALTLPATSPVSAGVDPNDFPPGHPNVTATPTDQLRSYPLPRYKTGHTLMRNFNWMDPMYFGSWTQPNVTYAQVVTNSVNVVSEMAKNWNYYLVASSNTGSGYSYTDTTVQQGALVNLCNKNPTIPCSAISFWAQISPSAIGRPSGSPYINAINLPASHYLRNASGNFIDANGNVTSSKIWSPARPLDSTYYDGQTQKFYINKLLSALTRPLNIINENAEVIPLLQSTGMSQDPAVVADKNASGLDWSTYFGSKKEKASTYYKDQFMSIPALANTIYTEYSIDGQQDWRPKYSEARKTSSVINGMHYATPDFYPRWPNNWRYWQSAWHGWQWIVECRKNELAVGDKLYSPFVCAGWDYNEENNMRPGQYLGMLKTLAMSGAEFYYSAYFSLTIPTQNPNNYTWQAAMPAYAQAITSRYEDLLRNGYLMDGDAGNTYINPTGPGYSFKTGDTRILVVARKHNTLNKYAITGTLQPSNNMIGNTAIEGTAKIILDGQTLKFKVRRQGSTYFYDKTNPSSPVFYQLDEWHEASHPSRWSHDFNVEGELYENTSPAFVIKTTVPAGTAAGDFTNYSSYVTYNDTSSVFNPMNYSFTPRVSGNSTYYLWIRARSRNGATTGASISVDGGSALNISCITDTSWNWYRFDACSQQAIKFMNLSLQNHILSLSPANAKFELDKFMLTTDANLILNPAPPSCSASTATITSNGSTTVCSGGSVILTASSGQTYLWTNGSTNQNITVTTSGSYGVAVGMAGGCSASATPVVVSVVTPTATVTANGPTSFCQPGTVQLSANAGTAYIWTNGATTQVITVSTSGNYGVKVTTNGCSASSPSIPVTASTTPTAAITANGPLNFCQGGNVSLTATSASTYLWSPGGQTTQTITVNTAGNYTVKVTNAGGCSNTSAPSVVTVSNSATATVTANGSTSNLCPGSTVQLTSSAGQSYSWSNGSTTQSITVTSAGNYSVSVNNGGGCSAVSSATTVSYSTNPSALITAGGPLTFCQGGNVTLTAASAAAYLWSPGGQTTQSVVVNASGNYSVKVTNANGCSNTSAATTVTVSNTATATVTANGSTSNLCPGSTVQLTSSSGQSYNWSNGATTQTITVTSAGIYSVTVNNGSGCSAVSLPKTVSYSTNPSATISAGGPLTFCQGGSVTLTSSQGASYLWSTGESTQNISVTTSGNYSVVVSNANGCSATSAAVTVSAGGNVNATVSASGSTVFCQGGAVTLTTSQGSSYYWYPNGETTQSIYVTSSGYYYAVVTASGGCTGSTAIKQVTVNPKPSATITASGSTAIIPGGSVTLSCATADGYLWSPGGQSTQSITVSDTGNYKVMAFSQNGCASNSLPVHVTYSTATVAITPSGSTNICTGDQLQLTATSGLIYLWSTGEKTKSILVSTGGTYMVTVTNADGSQGTATVNVNVNSKPLEPHISVSYIPNTAYQLTAYEPSAQTYLWSSGSTLQTIMVSSMGNYTVKVTNGFGCTNISQVFTVAPVGAQSCVASDMLTAYNILDTSASLEWNPSITGNSFKIIYYEKGSVNFITKTVSGTTYKTDLSGLLPGKVYKWFVQTICGNISYYSAVAYFNTLDGPLNCGSTPLNTSTQNIRSKDATLQWYPTTTDKFIIQYKETSASTYKHKTISGAGYEAGGVKLFGLTPSTTYEWSVQTECNGVNSLYSKAITFKTHDACPQPVNTYHTAVTNTTVTLHWEANLPADTMRVRFYEKGTLDYKIRLVPCNPVNPGYLIISNLKPETDYVYAIKGKCEWGGSDYSNEREFSTLANPNIPISDNPNDALKLIGYPNPASDLFNFGFITTDEGEYTVEVCDMMGQVILSETKTAQKGINGGSLNVDLLSNGLYTLVLQKKAQVSRFKFSVH